MRSCTSGAPGQSHFAQHMKTVKYIRLVPHPSILTKCNLIAVKHSNTFSNTYFPHSTSWYHKNNFHAMVLFFTISKDSTNPAFGSSMIHRYLFIAHNMQFKKSSLCYNLLYALDRSCLLNVPQSQ